LKSNDHFGEIIESSLNNFLAQSWRWDHAPSFGSLLVAHTETRTIFGLVSQVKTGSMDATRYPFAYQKTEEELRREQPQIFEFLKTTFSSIIIGYQEKGRIFYVLAPEPPKIHTMLRAASDQEYKNFFISDHYLSLLFSSGGMDIHIDELFLAIVRHHAQHGLLYQERLEHMVTTFSLLTNNDYVRLKLLLQRIESFI
jgi:hypothetical protein